jgi:hypothetical protein
VSETAEQEPVPAAAVPRKTRRLIWGTAILLAALLLGTAGVWVLSSWYIQKNNDRWCHFYAVVTRPLPNGGDALLIAELDRLRVESGC